MVSIACILGVDINPDRLGVIMRPGIPVTEAVRPKDTRDLWAAGAQYRPAWDTYQSNQVARPGKETHPVGPHRRHLHEGAAG
jgi:hypothetical protein